MLSPFIERHRKYKNNLANDVHVSRNFFVKAVVFFKNQPLCINLLFIFDIFSLLNLIPRRN